MKNVLKMNLARPTVNVPINNSATGERCGKCKEGSYLYSVSPKKLTVNDFECRYWEVDCVCSHCAHVIQTVDQQDYNVAQVEKLIDLTDKKRRAIRKAKRGKIMLGTIFGVLVAAITAVEVYSRWFM